MFVGIYYCNVQFSPIYFAGKVSILAGTAGFFLVSSLVFHKSTNPHTQQKYHEAVRITIHQIEMVASSSTYPCEHLYGAAGCLYAIRFLRRHVMHSLSGTHTVHLHVIMQIPICTQVRTCTPAHTYLYPCHTPTQIIPYPYPFRGYGKSLS
ncbi:hypothetical protein EON63_01255 [archaeon]|nr:MAG: hypothetical protein EON63_01255 [archaeon]